MAQPIEGRAPVYADDAEPDIRGGGEFGSPNPPDVRGAFMGDFLGKMRDRADQRRDRQQNGADERIPVPGGGDRTPPPGGGVRQQQGADALSLQHHGSIGRLDMPRGFSKGVETDPRHPINTSVHSPDSYRVYRSADDPNTKICYWKLDAYSPGADSVAALQRLLTPGRNNPPHRLSEAEKQAISEAIPNSLYGYNGNFDVVQLSTADVNGKRVLMMETKFKDTDRKTIGIFTNPDLRTTSIELAWFEAPAAGYKAHAKDAWKAITSLQWEGQQAPAQQPGGLFRRR